MNQIPPHALWIGSAGDLRDYRRLYDLNITAVVQVAYEELMPALPHDFVVCRFPLVDGGENDAAVMRAAVATLTLLLEQRFGTLVCCQAGLSRSPGIAAAALHRFTGDSLAVCLQRIAAYHGLDMHPAFFAQVQAICYEP